MEAEGSTYFLQLKAMMMKNMLLRKREIWRTISELFQCLLWLFFIIVLKLVMPSVNLPALKTPHGETDLFVHYHQLEKRTVAIVPNTNETQQFLDKVNELWQTMYMVPGRHPITFKKFNTTEELFAAYWNDPTSIPLAVIFETDDPVKGILKYEIRTNPSLVETPATTELYASPESCREIFAYDCPAEKYYLSDFVAIQALFDFTKIRLDSGQEDIKLPHIKLELFPKEAYIAETFLVVFRSVVPLFLVMGLSMFISSLLTLIVAEKENKIKGNMKIMGLRDSVYWLSWFICYVPIVFLLSVISSILLFMLRVLQHSNVLLVFLLFLLYSFSVIPFAFMLTPFFDKAKTAETVGFFILIILGLLYFIQVFAPHSPVAVFWAVSLISTTAFALAMDKALVWDMKGVGLTFDNWWSGPGMPFGGGLVMIVLDIILYGLLTYYLDSVIPRSLNTAEEMNNDVEPIARDMEGREGIKIVNLYKTFRGFRKPKVKAVNGINLIIYEGQITAILGHNGAGKTTVFNILTGLTPPTAGTAFVFGYDIRNSNDMSAIRRMTGVCPQEDTLFDLLTPREHLKFFATVRGIPSSLKESEVSKVLHDTDLEDKADTFAKNLSGGQKRKLSVGIAIIGDPKIIILDEPTSGLDPYSKRHIWSVLQNIRHGKVILLTTHYMDEADILAERKAVISKGRLRCCGSSLFLKNKFGIGYHLTLVLNSDAREDAITSLVTTHVPEAEKARQRGQELSFILPYNAVDNFIPLFSAIEQEVSSGRLGINSYGVSMANLEEVFLQLEREDETDGSIDNLSKKMVRNRALSRSISLANKSPSYQSLQKEGSVTTGSNTGVGDVQLDGMVNQVGDVAMYDWRLEHIDVKPNSCQIFIALIRLRVLRIFREISSWIVLILLVFILSTTFFYVEKLQNTVTIPKMESLVLSGDTYKTDTVIAFHNSTSSSLDILVKALEASGAVAINQYNGSYSLLLEIAPHLAALNIYMLEKREVNITMLYNDTAQHSLPIIMNLLSNAMHRIEMGNKELDNNHIVVKSYPFQGTSPQTKFKYRSIESIGICFVILATISILDVVYDREIKARSQLRVNGVGFFMYFLAYYAVLVPMILFISLGLLWLIYAFDIPSLQEPPAFGTMAALIILNIPTSILFITCVSYRFDKMETAGSVLFNVTVALTLFPNILVHIFDTYRTARTVTMALHIFFSLVNPFYVPTAAIYFVGKVYLICQINPACKHLTLSDYLTDYIIVMFVAMLLQIPILFFILLKLDVKKYGGHTSGVLKIFQRSQGAIPEAMLDNSDVGENEDDDVRAERQKVADILVGRVPDPTIVVVQNLRKEYRNTGDEGGSRSKVAVRNLSFCVDAGEVFGLLGQNGAGKTTTMKIMIAEEAATKGRVYIGGHYITSTVSEAFKIMGYCPQHDAQWKNITVREHLECYALIRGVPHKQISRVVDMCLTGLQMKEHANKQAQRCSGGTRRKLSFAMAMVGNPRVVLMDEPSRGMDPHSKRFLWDIILLSFQGNRGAILTTHSMEEADALCSRVGIMDKGEFRCIGSTQHLKNLYGAGYTLEIKMQGDDSTTTTPSSDRANDIKEFVSGLFPDATLEESFADHMSFSIPQNSVTSLAKCFSQLEKAKSELGIEEYSFSQKTLEQIFIKFAQTEEVHGD